MTLAQTIRGQVVRIARIGGDRGFRRRLMELGLVPGTRVELVGVAPLGDPIELLVRGCSISIRRAEALEITVEPMTTVVDIESRATACAVQATPCAGGCGSCALPQHVV